MGTNLSIQTFPLSEAASAKMQQIIDKGGYQYGDKVKLEYDPQSDEGREVQRQTVEAPLIPEGKCCACLL